MSEVELSPEVVGRESEGGGAWAPVSEVELSPEVAARENQRGKCCWGSFLARNGLARDRTRVIFATLVSSR